MPIERTPPAEVERRHRLWEEALGGGSTASASGERGAGERLRVLNVTPVVYLTDPVAWPYAGRVWLVPPVSVEDGFRVLELVERDVHRADGGIDPEAMRAWTEDALALIRRLVRPRAPRGPFSRLRGWIRTLSWRCGITRHPWKRGTYQDIGEILGFFWMRRTKRLESSPFGAPPTPAREA